MTKPIKSSQHPAQKPSNQTLAIITGEYPPNKGGVSDYTFQISDGLTRSGLPIQVVVFRCKQTAHVGQNVKNVSLNVRNVGCAWNPLSFWRATKILRSSGGKTVILLQYVPQMYGLKGMNFIFILWLCAPKRTTLWVMFHEFYVEAPPEASLRHRMLALVTRKLAYRLVARADRCFASVPSIVSRIKKLRPDVPAEWIKIPSNLNSSVDDYLVREIRQSLKKMGNSFLIGHFGTYGKWLQEILQGVIEICYSSHMDWRFILIGSGSAEFLSRIEERSSVNEERAIASGYMPAETAACWISACDILLQPFPEGASSRHATLTAGLALGKAIVSNRGPLCDFDGAFSRAVYLVNDPIPELLIRGLEDITSQKSLRNALESEALSTYRGHFSLENSLRILHESFNSL